MPTFCSASRPLVEVLLASAVLFPTSSLAAQGLTIVANSGPFPSLEQAAASETQVDFWDDDLRDDDACTESFAALELRRFLARCVGITESDVDLRPPTELPQEGTVILLGSRRSNALLAGSALNGSGAPPTVPGAFTIHIRTDRGRKLVAIRGTDRVGTLYGTYALLELLGMRFFGLDDKGTVYPAAPVNIPDQLELSEQPGFLTRGFYACAARGNEAFFLWMARNRMNLWIAAEPNVRYLKKLGFQLNEGGHGIQQTFLGASQEYPYNHPRFNGDEDKPADPYAASDEYLGDVDEDGKLSYGEAHPEWYAVRGGKRQGHLEDKPRTNYCTSNPDATRELARNLVRCLIDGAWRHADIVDLMALDHGPWCECPSCQEQGTPTDRLLAVQHRVYREIETARREGRLRRKVRLTIPAYLETLPPPTRPLPEGFDFENCRITFFPISRCYAHPLADPACQEINRHTLDCYLGWERILAESGGGALSVGEYYNVSSIKSLPVVYSRLMAADIPWYYRHGARYLHYMHSPTSLWGTWTLNQRLLARLLWNPQVDVSRLLDDYFERYYPTTTAHTRRFYAHLEHATANIKAFKHHVWVGDGYHCLPGKLDQGVKNLFPMQHLQYARSCPPLNDAPDVVEIIESMNDARREIDDALLACTDDRERERLLEDEHRFAYGESMFRFLYHLVRISMFHHRGQADAARREFLAVEREANRLREMVDVVQVAFRHANAKNGLEASQAEPAYRFFKERYETEPKAQGSASGGS